MARGFHTTYGVASTDKITSALTSNSTLRSWALWAFRREETPAYAARLFAKTFGGDRRAYTGGSSVLFEVECATTTGQWSVAKPTELAWHHYVFTYDEGSSSNDPVIYIDGVSVSVTRLTGPVGVPLTNSDPFSVGNRVSSDRCWDGMLAEFGIWDRLLEPWEARLLGGSDHVGVNWFPTGLVEYIYTPDTGAPSSFLGGPTVSGTAEQPSPPINYSLVAPYMSRQQSSPILAQ